MDDEKESLVDQALLLLEHKDYSGLRAFLGELMPADINEFFEELPEEKLIVLYRLLPKELAAEVFVEMDPDRQEYLIRAFSDAELKATLDELYYDDTADIIEEMPASVVKRILNTASPDMRKAVNELLKYPEDSAGSIMTTEFVRLKKNYTVQDSFDLIRHVGIDKETIYTCYVTDDKNHLIGFVTVKDLLLAPLQRLIEDIMTENVIAVNTLDDQEQIAMMFSKYDFIALPVVDNEERLVGIITVDDAIDVLQEETEEDFAKMAAITPNDTEYLKTPVTRIWFSRVPWLLLLMISATFTGIIISKFESALAALPILTAFIPMLMDTGGNSGSQASVTVIRGISLGQVEFSDTFRVLWKEIRVAFLCGITLSACNFVKLLLGNLARRPSYDGKGRSELDRCPCGIDDAVSHHFLRKNDRLFPAAACEEDRLRPCRNGKPVHYDHCRRGFACCVFRHFKTTARLDLRLRKQSFFYEKQYTIVIILKIHDIITDYVGKTAILQQSFIDFFYMIL